MKCTNCNAIVDDESVFCSNCGTAIVTEISCKNCQTINSSDSKFCKNCGALLTAAEQESPQSSQMEDNQGDKIILGDDFMITLRELYYEKLSNRVNHFNETEDIHSKVRTMKGATVKTEYETAVKKCFDHLISEAKSCLSRQDINDIKSKRDIFLGEETETFYDLLEKLDAETERIEGEVSSESESIINSAISGVKIGFESDNWMDTAFSFGKHLMNENKAGKKEQKIIEGWEAVYSLALEEIDALWGKMLESFNEIAEEKPIVFDVSEGVFEKYDQENKNPIESIIENNLAFDDSDFYFYSNIPLKKKEGALESYVKLDEDEEIICLYDSTVFGGAKEGICLTDHGIYWKELGEDGNYIPYSDIEKIKVKDDQLFINGFQVESCPCLKELRNTLKEIQNFLNESSEEE